MQGKRLLGPPAAAAVVSGIAIVVVVAGLLFAPGLETFSVDAVLVFLVWRLLTMAVYTEGNQLVVRNALKTYRFPIGDVDIRARIIDPRSERYRADGEGDVPTIPTMADDNTPRAAKRYQLETVTGDIRLTRYWGVCPSIMSDPLWSYASKSTPRRALQWVTIQRPSPRRRQRSPDRRRRPTCPRGFPSFLVGLR